MGFVLLCLSISISILAINMLAKAAAIFIPMVQCLRQSAPLRESRVTISDGPQKNEKRATLALSLYKTAGLTQA